MSREKLETLIGVRYLNYFDGMCPDVPNTWAGRIDHNDLDVTTRYVRIRIESAAMIGLTRGALIDKLDKAFEATRTYFERQLDLLQPVNFMGEPVHIIDEDDGRCAIQIADSDAYEIRIASYPVSPLEQGLSLPFSASPTIMVL